MIFPMIRSSLIQHDDTFSHEHIDTSYSSEHPSATSETNAKRYFDISPEDFRSGYMCLYDSETCKRFKSYVHIQEQWSDNVSDRQYNDCKIFLCRSLWLDTTRKRRERKEYKKVCLLIRTVDCMHTDCMLTAFLSIFHLGA